MINKQEISKTPKMGDFVGMGNRPARVFYMKLMLNIGTAVSEAIHEVNGSSSYGCGKCCRKGHR